MSELLPGHVVLLVAIVTILLGAAWALHWAYRTGQFSDLEEPKYRMMEEPWNEGNPYDTHEEDQGRSGE